jgi:putative toxin-antitoxin system antitoxin component (TIGR02293 family)
MIATFVYFFTTILPTFEKLKFIIIAMAKQLDIADPGISYNSIDDRNVIVIIEALRNGITFAIFFSFAKKTPFTLNEWSGFLHMSERTMQRHKREKKTFDTIYSEKILQISLLYNLGIEVFGNSEKFNTWLEAINVALGGIKPKQLLDTSFGIGLLKDELQRIEHGILA